MKLPVYALLGFASLTIAACGPDDEKKEITTTQLHEIVAQNTANASNVSISGAKFLENKAMLEKLLKRTQLFGTTDCTGHATEGGGFEERCETTHDVSIDFGDASVDKAEIQDYLQKTLFKATNIESDTGTEITYLIHGDSVCPEADPMFPSSCIADVDKAEIRLVVTSPAANDVDIDILVGPNRVNPFSLEIHDELMAIEADLDGMKASLDYFKAQNIIESKYSLPDTFEGRTRAELKIEGAKKVSGSLEIQRAIHVAGAEYEFKTAVASPLYKISLDGVAEQLKIEVGAGLTDIKILHEQDEGGANKKFDILHLAGLSGELLIDGKTDIISLTNLGFGDAQSSFSLKNREIVTLDFNPSNGRHLDLSLQDVASGYQVELGSALDIEVGLNFDPNDAPEFLKDETAFKLLFDGAAKPSLIIRDNDELEAVAGNLKLELVHANQSLTIPAGQCLSERSTGSGDGLDALIVGVCE